MEGNISFNLLNCPEMLSYYASLNTLPFYSTTKELFVLLLSQSWANKSSLIMANSIVSVFIVIFAVLHVEVKSVLMTSWLLQLQWG